MATIRIGVTVAESSLAMQAVLPSGVTAMAWGDLGDLDRLSSGASGVVNGYLIGARAGAYYSSAASAADGGGLWV